MRRWGLMLVYLSAVTLGACGPPVLQRSDDPVARTYVLEWAGAAGLAPVAPAGPTLLISPVLSAPGFDRSDMAYMRRPHQLEYFANHRWVDAPARMLDPLLVSSAAQTGLFRGVVEAGGGARADLRLDSRLLHLVQVCRLNPSELQLALRVSLVDVPSGRVLGSSTLSITEPIGERTPVAGVEAANRALHELLSQVQGFLAAQTKIGDKRAE